MMKQKTSIFAQAKGQEAHSIWVLVRGSQVVIITNPCLANEIALTTVEVKGGSLKISDHRLKEIFNSDRVVSNEISFL